MYYRRRYCAKILRFLFDV